VFTCLSHAANRQQHNGNSHANDQRADPSSPLALWRTTLIVTASFCGVGLAAVRRPSIHAVFVALKSERDQQRHTGGDHAYLRPLHSLTSFRLHTITLRLQEIARGMMQESLC
jgi:hypothetical protein